MPLRGIVHRVDQVKPSKAADIIAHIQRRSGSNVIDVTKADIANITWACYQLPQVTNVVDPVSQVALANKTASGTLDPLFTIFDSLQTGSVWTQDNLGYNFLATFPGACWPAGNFEYQLKVTFIFVSGDQADLWFATKALDVVVPEPTV